MPRKTSKRKQIPTVSTEETGTTTPLTLIGATYGEISVGTRYASVDDSDPYALRFVKRRSTKTVDHTDSIPVFVASDWRPPVYTECTVKELIKAIEDHFGPGTQRYRYDPLTNQLIIGLPKAPCITIPPPGERKPEGETLSAPSSSSMPRSAVKETTPSGGGEDEEDDQAETDALKVPLEEIAAEISELAGKPVNVNAIAAQAYKNDLGKHLPKKRG